MTARSPAEDDALVAAYIEVSRDMRARGHTPRCIMLDVETGEHADFCGCPWCEGLLPAETAPGGARVRGGK